jgi:hypothetical protein
VICPQCGSGVADQVIEAVKGAKLNTSCWSAGVMELGNPQ